MISRRQDGVIMEHGYKVLNVFMKICVCVCMTAANQPDNHIHYMGEHNPTVKLQILTDVVNRYLAH
jgi:hypothetical protein